MLEWTLEREETSGTTPRERYEVPGKLQASRGPPDKRVTIGELQVAYYTRGTQSFCLRGNTSRIRKAEKKYTKVPRQYSATAGTVARNLNKLTR